MPRTQINRTAIIVVLRAKYRSAIAGKEDEENKATVNILIAKILVYSAIKISAKGPLLYSVLKPETSSDSPSAKSNGVRLVSASIVINHTVVIGKTRNIGQTMRLNPGITKLYELNVKMADNKIKDILTSYEIVCAILRSAPIKEYLELEDHPAIRVVYTFSLEMHRNKSTPNDKIMDGVDVGKSAHKKSARQRLSIGAK